MNQKTGYIVAAILFAIATCLNLYNDGPNLMTAVGLVFIMVMAMLARRAGRSQT